MGAATKDGDTNVVNADGGDGGATVVQLGPLQQHRMIHLSLLMPRPDMVS
jgi:NADPH-dependent curcumin reductase CurA